MNYFENSNAISIRKVVCENCESFANVVTRHNHEVFEINVVLSGNLHFTVDGEKYIISPGQAIVVNPFSFHSAYWGNCQKGEFLSLIFDMRHFLMRSNSQFLQKNCELIMSGSHAFSIFHKSKILQGLLVKLLNLSKQKNTWSDCLIYSAVYELISYLFESHYEKASHPQAINPKNEFLRKTSSFIQENYSRTLTTTDIAKALYMSPSVFCHKFKKTFGTNFTDYLCEYRVNISIELYRKSQLSLTEIAYNVGFSSYNYFTKMFKKYVGTSPAIYFGKWKNI